MKGHFFLYLTEFTLNGTVGLFSDDAISLTLSKVRLGFARKREGGGVYPEAKFETPVLQLIILENKHFRFLFHKMKFICQLLFFLRYDIGKSSFKARLCLTYVIMEEWIKSKIISFLTLFLISDRILIGNIDVNN